MVMFPNDWQISLKALPMSNTFESGTSPESAGQAKTLSLRETEWLVILFNDDYTPFDWVIDILVRVFERAHDDAVIITNTVHHAGKGIAGVFPREKAQSLAEQANRLSREAGHPFTCIAQPFGDVE